MSTEGLIQIGVGIVLSVIAPLVDATAWRAGLLIIAGCCFGLASWQYTESHQWPRLYFILACMVFAGGFSYFFSWSTPRFINPPPQHADQTSRENLANLIVKNHYHTDPPIERHAKIFIPQWLQIITSVLEERTEHDLQSVMQQFGRRPVALSGEGLIAEARFTLLCLEKEGYIRIKNSVRGGKWWGIEFTNLNFEFVPQKLGQGLL